MSASQTRKPPKQAIALSYDPENDVAPVVSAVGRGHVAEEILRRAKAAGVPVREDEQMASLLVRLDVGDVIPPELYVVVAEVLAYVYRLEAKLGHRR